MTPKRRRTPQEKKALSLKRDRRNDWGNNDKAARKSIPRSKAKALRAVRKASNQALAAEGGERSDAILEVRSKRRWRKYPDAPLEKVVERDIVMRQWTSRSGERDGTLHDRMEDRRAAHRDKVGRRKAAADRPVGDADT